MRATNALLAALLVLLLALGGYGVYRTTSQDLEAEQRRENCQDIARRALNLHEQIERLRPEAEAIRKIDPAGPNPHQANIDLLTERRDEAVREYNAWDCRPRLPEPT